MQLPEALLERYKKEYKETSNTTPEAILAKYGVPASQVDTSSWHPQLQEPLTKADKIEILKNLALDHAATWMHEKVEYTEVKEFKDIVNIILAIENSYKSSEPESQTNILVQNLVQKYATK